jgi:hypothetical protein
MRKLVWGGVVACLVAGGFGVHFGLQKRSRHVETVVPAAVEEEQESPRAAFVPMPQSTPSVGKLLEMLDIVEPIVVEGPPDDPPPAPQIGGAVLPGQRARVVALGSDLPPRPDEEPGQAKTMPYAAEAQAGSWLGARLWEALARMFAGTETTRPMPLNETAEPPMAEEQSEPLPVQGPLPSIIDHRYHEQEMHCPYTGRCPLPVYPVPPAAAPELK